jgi:hypothetical protein
VALLPSDGAVVEQLDNHTLYIYDASTNTWNAVGGGGGGGFAFGVIQTPSGTAPTADTTSDTLTLTSSDSSIGITGNALTDTVDLNAISSPSLITVVYNQSGTTITKGSVVYISGSHGNLPAVSLAKADSEVTSARTYGLVIADISNMSSGKVVHSGVIGNLNTFGIPEGTQLYLSPTTAGAYTTTKPLAPYHLVYVGVITREHPTQGTIEVTIQNGYELYEIHDVSVPHFPSAPADKVVLEYNATSGLWEDGTPKVDYPTAIAYAIIFG